MDNIEDNGDGFYFAPLELSLFWGRGAIIRSFLRNYGCARPYHGVAR
jgi:hypothetical protein